MSSCLGRAAVPAKRLWRGLSARLGVRRRTTGLGRLRKEVRTCEYNDVHVMWEMLSKPSGSTCNGGTRDGQRATAGKGAVAETRRARTGRKVSAVAAAAAAWRRLASYCCAL